MCSGARGKCLGFIISERRIEVDLEKIKAIQGMPALKNVQDMQRLSCCLAYLGQFLVRMGENSLLIYRLLKGVQLSHRTWRASNLLSSSRSI